MGEYVEIKSSPGEIIRIADSLADRGRALAGTVGGINKQINSMEAHPETFPIDQFTEQFVGKYNEMVTGADGKSMPANEALQQSALFLGNRLVDIGDTVNTAMTNYEATDDESGQSIGRLEQI